MTVLGIGISYGLATLLAMFSGMPIAFALGAVAVVFMAIYMPAASLDTVTAFYSDRLNHEPWAVTAKNPVDGTWKFRRTDGKMTGLIRLSGHGQQTRIDVLLLK